ncbi:MAG: hypothetical protein DRN71_01175 [Candidatus Nanohalarchaeota archaeon]|nr:MAG: hypothetical protein DRN71_01175 [Candidatus Nanohaloarchaeota archaeon]
MIYWNVKVYIVFCPESVVLGYIFGVVYICADDKMGGFGGISMGVDLVVELLLQSLPCLQDEIPLTNLDAAKPLYLSGLNFSW